MARLNNERIYHAIREGKPGTGMAAWGRLLNDDEIHAVMRYLHSLEQPRPAHMTQKDFDIQVGENIYRQYCKVCHGGKGDGQTTIGHALNQHPRNFSSIKTMTTLSDEQMARAIEDGKPGTAMVAWKSLLSTEDTRRIILFLHHAFR